MNRPSQTDHAVCHPLAIAVIFGLAFCLLARFCLDLQNHGSPSLIMPIVALVMCKRVADGRKRIAAFRQWRSEWDEMRGDPPRAAAEKPRKRAHPVLLGFACWLLLFGWLATDGAAPGAGHDLASVALVLLSLWGLWGVLRRLGRVVLWLITGPSAPVTRATSAHVVTVCLGRASRSPGSREFTNALPAYCKTLLASSAASVPF